MIYDDLRAGGRIVATDAVRTKAAEFIAQNPGARASKVLKAILERGSITTEELLGLGYKHAPRARMDCIDHGFPIKTTMVKGSDGGRMASYSLYSEVELRETQNGRSIIPKAFKAKLVKRRSKGTPDRRRRGTPFSDNMMLVC